MKGILSALVALAAVASAACRQYDVDVYRNFNGKVLADQNQGITQSFTCTADSLLWAEFFVGAENAGGRYDFDIREQATNDLAYTGYTVVAGQNYTYVRCSTFVEMKPFVKGREYVLKVTLSNPTPNESLNYYYSDQDPYKYGCMGHSPDGNHECPEDLACRIEGTNRPVSREFFGMNGMHCGWDSPTVERHYALMDTAGIGTVREDISWHALSPVRDSFNWTIFDPIAIAAATHHMRLLVILQSCPDWASTRIDSIESDGDTVWERNCPPRAIAEPVESGGSANPNNYFGYYVHRVVNRYKPGSSFWSSVGIDDESAGIRYYEVWNEPSFWKPPQLGYDCLRAQFGEDTVGLVETLYARTCVVACSAAQAAYAGARVIIGGGLSDVFAHPDDGSVNGADWLTGFYQYGGCGGRDYGASVHPYQADSLALKPNLLARDLDTIQTLRRVNGDEGKELWVSELSWGTGDTGVTGRMRAALSVPEAYTFALAGTPTTFCSPIVWYCLSVGPARLISYPTVREPCGYASQQMTSKLLGRRMNGRVLSGNPATDSVSRVYELEDTASGKKTWVGWRNYESGGAGVAVRIPTRTDKLDIAPLARSTDADRLNRKVTARGDGWLGLTLDTIPVYVHETGTAMRPDLTVDSIWTEEELDSRVTLHARVKNIGNKQFVSSGKKGSVLRFAIDGVPVSPTNEPKKLAPGGVAVVKSAPISPDRGLAHLVSAEANPDREMMELNFDNNAGYCHLAAR